MREVRWWLCAAAWAALTAFPAQAAVIERLDSKGMTAIVIMGELALGDDTKFIDLAVSIPNAVVVLDSPGGSLVAGLGIGRAIHLKGFGTAVAKGDTCTSACALAWLGGRQRALFPGARVGFHAAYYKDASGKSVTASSGNALVGAYLNQIGLSSNAIVFVTSQPPDGIAWLTPGDATRNGIEMRQVEEGSLASSRPAPAAPRQVARSPEDWTGYGEWVQVASRKYLSEATDFAREASRRNANTNVFRYANGWYGVVIGPFSAGRGAVALDALVRASEAPDDSLLVRGDKFTSLEWGRIPQPKASRPAIASPAMADMDD